jgi:hypothetical protein
MGCNGGVLILLFKDLYSKQIYLQREAGYKLCEVTFDLKFAQGQNTLIPFFPTLHKRAHSRQPPDRREQNKSPTNLYPTLVTVHQCAESWLVANPQT